MNMKNIKISKTLLTKGKPYKAFHCCHLELAVLPLVMRQKFEIICGLLEATSEFRTEHLLLKAFE